MIAATISRTKKKQQPNGDSFATSDNICPMPNNV